MDVFIYFKEPTGYGIDELEDVLTDALGDIGEVTGTGTGERGSNLDVELFGDIEEARALDIVREALAAFSLPGSSEVVIDGNRHKLIKGS